MLLNSSTRLSGRASWEGSPKPRFRPWSLAALLMVMAGVLLGFVVREVEDMRAVFIEDGPVETVQAVVLGGSAIVFGMAFAKSTGARAVFCLVATFAIIFAVSRELPRCDSAFVGGDACLTGGWKRAIILLAAGLCSAALILRRREFGLEVLRLSNIRWVWPTFIIILMLGGADAAERRVLVELEESLELAAYLYLLAFGIRILRNIRIEVDDDQGGDPVPSRDRRPEESQ